jgi:hypothetical protein
MTKSNIVPLTHNTCIKITGPLHYSTALHCILHAPLHSNTALYYIAPLHSTTPHIQHHITECTAFTTPDHCMHISTALHRTALHCTSNNHCMHCSTILLLCPAPHHCCMHDTTLLHSITLRSQRCTCNAPQHHTIALYSTTLHHCMNHTTACTALFHYTTPHHCMYHCTATQHHCTAAHHGMHHSTVHSTARTTYACTAQHHTTLHSATAQHHTTLHTTVCTTPHCTLLYAPHHGMHSTIPLYYTAPLHVPLHSTTLHSTTHALASHHTAQQLHQTTVCTT